MNRLRELRKAKKMTQQEVASILGVERSTYGKYETGAITIANVDLLQRLSELYGVSSDYIRGISDSRLLEPSPDISSAKAAMIRLIDGLSDQQAEQLLTIAQAALSINGDKD